MPVLATEVGVNNLRTTTELVEDVVVARTFRAAGVTAVNGVRVELDGVLRVRVGLAFSVTDHGHAVFLLGLVLASRWTVDCLDGEVVVLGQDCDFDTAFIFVHCDFASCALGFGTVGLSQADSLRPRFVVGGFRVFVDCGGDNVVVPFDNDPNLLLSHNSSFVVVGFFV